MKIDYNLAVMFMCIGFALSSLVDYALNRHKQEIIKTNIGEFIIRDSKVYGVYEIQRNAQGDMVVR